MTKRKGQRTPKQAGRGSKRPSRERKLNSFAERHLWWVIAGLVLIGAVCSYLVFNPNLDTSGDNALFIVLGMSLAQGKGLSTICTPGEPANTMVPFGYPLLLAPFVALSPDNHLVLKLLSTTLFLLSLPLLLVIIKDREKNLYLPLGVAFLAAINLHLLDFGHMVMTEIPFLFFSLLGIWVLQRAMGSAGQGLTGKQKTLLGISIVALVFAYHIRSIGVVLLLTMLILLVLRRHYRLALVAGLFIILLVLPWALRNHAIGQGGGYLDQFVMKNPYDPAQGHISVGGMVARMGENLRTYALFVIPQALFPSISPAAGYRGAAGFSTLVGVVASLVILVGFFSRLRKSVGFLELYIFFFLGVCVLWPQMWSGMRFVIPVVPFVIYYFLAGAQGAAEKLKNWLTPLAGRSLILLALAVMLISSFSGLTRASGRRKGYPREWHNYFLAAQWSRENTDAESIFVARKPSLFYLKARRAVLNYPYTAMHQEMIDFMDRNDVDYVLVDGFSWTGTTMRYLVPAIQSHQDRFEPVFRLDNPTTWVLKMVELSPQGDGR